MDRLASQASASYLTEYASGKTLDELAQIDHNDLIDALGREVVLAEAPQMTAALGAANLAAGQKRALALSEANLTEAVQ